VCIVISGVSACALDTSLYLHPCTLNISHQWSDTYEASSKAGIIHVPQLYLLLPLACLACMEN